MERQTKELLEQRADEFVQKLQTVQTVQELGSLIKWLDILEPHDSAESIWAFKLLGRKIQSLGSREEDENRQLVYMFVLASFGAVIIADSIERLTEDFSDKVDDLIVDPFQESKDESDIGFPV
ncbi:MAG: hypothetical protein A2655_01400 [Candidatus Yanofskybacteria bacterium RIFCSPHIGHO2_01_FULL_43_42]|uniref:Uncharacterized protein n=1 Tax=Candidatus Yanofskybacteria bacterium RIFCSPLOWO2_01_FULL_43_22 TaxID=1802695 RepID=A0A1F8GGX2_9BACT|nr:MAG: hypothetical protein A2655_01400 [Candidatus Yanofskybacteria bacterium RIFCSPHIGHO2_01_FULL_43_42]OGN13140.1 MAG: hypothetical protein A3D48_02315 [Candidatus Yanofskybacteria bacterium RIFCSPHIGHO2_02_FULL_43_17]OGN24553.1 MAG: hypothetical protein A3A13_00530 [Candidatus Yanofskybacteria bacterium RIFCSPLOWO2_01_FULL_43_22]